MKFMSKSRFQTSKQTSDALTLSQAAEMLGPGITSANIYARIRRGSLAAAKDAEGVWHIPRSEVQRTLEAVGNCAHCDQRATNHMIIKYHHHERVEFDLCDQCVLSAERAYRRQGGVLEIVVYPVIGEGWMKP